MKYIHGENSDELKRLSSLNSITNKDFISFLGDLKGKKICEVGSGLGVLTNEIASNYEIDHLTGIEINKTNYEVSLKNNSSNKNVALINGDFLENNIPDELFDITYCRYVLEHVTNPKKVVNEMVRITKKGGYIICQENDLYNGILYPPIENYHEIRQLFAKLQQDLGGDPFIGRKLFDLFVNQDVDKIDFSIKPEIHTQNDIQFPMWINNLRALIMGVKDTLIKDYGVNSSDFDKVCLEMDNRIKCPYGTYLFMWNRIKVIK